MWRFLFHGTVKTFCGPKKQKNENKGNFRVNFKRKQIAVFKQYVNFCLVILTNHSFKLFCKLEH